MVNPSFSESVPTLLADTRARASRWTGQLGQLFGWLLVIEFGLMSVALGLIVTEWPQTPAFLANAAGAWLVMLAGCRGLAALAQTPSPGAGAMRRPAAGPGSAVSTSGRRGSPAVTSSPGRGAGPRSVAGRPTSPRSAAEWRPVWTRSMNGQTRPARKRSGPGVASPGSPAVASSIPVAGSSAFPAAVSSAFPVAASSAFPVAASSAFAAAASSAASFPAAASSAAGGSLTAVASPASPAGSVGRRVAIVEVAACFGTGFVLLQADWPGRPAAVPLALYFAGMAVVVCAALDVLVARFAAERYPRQRLIRAGGWLVSAVLLMALIRGSAPVALGIAAVLIGLVETALGGWLVNRAAVERRARGAADALSADDSEPRAEVDHGPLVDFLTGAEPKVDVDRGPLLGFLAGAEPKADADRGPLVDFRAGADPDPAPDFWPWAVPSETA